MLKRLFLFTALAITSTASLCATPGTTIVLNVKRLSEFQLPPKANHVLDEATKLEAACRAFYGLYGRWPTITEIKARTVGINYAIFGGKIALEPQGNGLLLIVAVAGNVRQNLITPKQTYSQQEQDDARSPAYKIRVVIHTQYTFASPSPSA